MPEVKVGTYIFTRLKELGVKVVFGVPGDYELALLDLTDEAGIRFSGNPNELIASYAADGYSRIHGVGAWVDTFGPGELSSFCGHAGAYTEFVPVAHIVGYPSRSAMSAHTIMHHTLGTGEFNVYHEMVKPISCATTVLSDPSQAPAEIDRCLQKMLDERRPCYIGVPVDMSHLRCDNSPLNRKLRREPLPSDAEIEKVVVKTVRKELDNAKSISIVVDGNTTRGGVVEQARKLSALTFFPTFVTVMGKGAADETASNFGGLYAGAGSKDHVISTLETSDTVLWIGPYPSDFNTGEFTETLKPEQKIQFSMNEVQIRSEKYPVKLKYVLEALCKDLSDSPLSAAPLKVTWEPFDAPLKASDAALTQDFAWNRLSAFLRTRDLLISETGTSQFGVAVMKLRTGSSMFNQTIFGSIGFATGAAVGAFQAIKETQSYDRGILVTGEGSMHLSVQAFMDMLKLRLNPIIIVLNNDGYVVERLIHGPTADYNKLQQLDYSLLAKTFGPEHPSKYWGPVENELQLDAVLNDKEFSDGKMFRLVELKLGPLDAPSWVAKLAAGVEAFNKKE